MPRDGPADVEGRFRLLEAAHAADPSRGVLLNAEAEARHADVVRLIDWVCDNWRREDEGIWEVRGGKQEFLYSRLLCWVAIDRGVRLALKQSFPAPLGRWLEVRDEIYMEIVLGNGPYSERVWGCDLTEEYVRINAEYN